MAGHPSPPSERAFNCILCMFVCAWLTSSSARLPSTFPVPCAAFSCFLIDIIRRHSLGDDNSHVSTHDEAHSEFADQEIQAHNEDENSDAVLQAASHEHASAAARDSVMHGERISPASSEALEGVAGIVVFSADTALVAFDVQGVTTAGATINHYLIPHPADFVSPCIFCERLDHSSREHHVRFAPTFVLLSRFVRL